MRKTRSFIFILCFFCLFIVSQGSSASGQKAVSISTKEYNTFKFTEPFSQVIFPPGAPLDSDVVPLSKKTAFLVKLKKGTKESTQMIVHFKSGQIMSFRLTPDDDIPGGFVNITVPKLSGPLAEKKKAKKKEPQYEPRNYRIDRIVNIFKSFNSAQKGVVAPEGFASSNMPKAIRFKQFLAKPMGAWSDGEYRMLVFNLEAKKGVRSVIAPPQFYRRGVVAIELNGGDLVDARHSPNLMILFDESVWNLK